LPPEYLQFTPNRQALTKIVSIKNFLSKRLASAAKKDGSKIEVLLIKMEQQGEE
jgi:hypothetical protein